jgi:hypothetical protein
MVTPVPGVNSFSAGTLSADARAAPPPPIRECPPQLEAVDRRHWRGREDLLGGSGPAEDVRASIARSWLRSREIGLSPGDR